MVKLLAINILLNENISLIISIVLFVGSVVIAFCLGYMPRIRKAELEKTKDSLKKRNIELVSLYKDVFQLIQVEAFLCDEAGISKQKARQGFTISEKCGKKYIENRIAKLEEDLQNI